MGWRRRKTVSGIHPYLGNRWAGHQHRAALNAAYWKILLKDQASHMLWQCLHKTSHPVGSWPWFHTLSFGTQRNHSLYSLLQDWWTNNSQSIISHHVHCKVNLSSRRAEESTGAPVHKKKPDAWTLRLSSHVADGPHTAGCQWKKGPLWPCALVWCSKNALSTLCLTPTPPRTLGSCRWAGPSPSSAPAHPPTASRSTPSSPATATTPESPIRANDKQNESI